MRPITLSAAFRHYRYVTEHFVDTHGRDYANNLAYRVARQLAAPCYKAPKTKLRLP